MIRVCSADQAQALPSASAEWVFFGVDVARRARVERRLGKPPRPMGAALRAECLRLRRPFLDLIAALGRPHASDPRWWAGDLAYKAWASSDLFRLCAYQSLARQFAASPRPLGVSELVVVVEDPWLHGQLAQTLDGKLAKVAPAPSLLSGLTAAPLLGLARRLKWALRTADAMLQSSATSLPPREPRPVLLFSHLQKRALSKTGFVDHYLTGLEVELMNAGKRVLRFHDSDVTNLASQVASLKGFLATPRFGSLFDLLAALRALPIRADESARLEGLPVGRLLAREWWKELSRAGLCSRLFFERCLDKMFAAYHPSSVVYPWENQPQDRMIARVARKRGARAVASQHTTTPLLQLPLYCGAGEAEWAPLPDVILCAGPAAVERLAEGGLPRRMLALGGARRAQDLRRHAPARRGKDVLVALPIDLSQAEHLLYALARAYPKAPFTFKVKLHPSEKPPRGLERLAGAVRAKGTLTEELEGCAAAVFCGTSSGIEALARGIPAVRYRAESLLDLDPADVLSDEELPTAGDAELGARLDSARSAESAKAAGMGRRAVEALYGPVLPAVWLAAVEGRDPQGARA